MDSDQEPFYRETEAEAKSVEHSVPVTLASQGNIPASFCYVCVCEGGEE